MMQLTDFPLLTKAITVLGEQSAVFNAAQVAKDPRRYTPKTAAEFADRQTKQVEMAIKLISNGVRAGEILNPRYKEAKDTIDRMIRSAYEALIKNPYLTAKRSNEYTAQEEEVMSELYWMGEPSLSKLPSFSKKLKKLAQGKVVPDLLKAANAFINELLPLGEAVNSLKDKIVKRQARSEEEKRDAKYAPPQSSAKAVEQVKTILEQVVEKSYQGLVDYFFNTYMRYVQAFFEAQEEVAAGTRERIKRHHGVFGPYEFATDKQGNINSQIAGIVEKAVVQKGWNNPYVKRPDAEAILRKKAVEEADDIRLTYIAKNLRKLTSILEAKGDDNFDGAKEVKTTNMGYLEGAMRISFKDGSAFTAENSVVFVINAFNTRFNRFPLTFRDVVMPGGKKMSAPSEKRMNTVFLGKAE